MRALAGTVLVLSSLSAIGCADRDPYNAYDVAAAQQFHLQQEAEATKRAPVDPNTVGAVRAAGPATVRCRCDEDGGLHVNAPQGSVVRVPEEATREDAEAEITVPERKPGTPIRRTVSLGFVGDGPLTQSPSRGGPWNVPDALLPAHQHVEPRYPPVWGVGFAPRGRYYGGYGSYGSYGSYGRGGSGGYGGSRGGAPAAQPTGGHNLNFSPHVRSSGVSFSRGGGGHGGGGGHVGGPR